MWAASVLKMAGRFDGITTHRTSVASNILCQYLYLFFLGNPLLKTTEVNIRIR